MSKIKKSSYIKNRFNITLKYEGLEKVVRKKNFWSIKKKKETVANIWILLFVYVGVNNYFELIFHVWGVNIWMGTHGKKKKKNNRVKTFRKLKLLL